MTYIILTILVLLNLFFVYSKKHGNFLSLLFCLFMWVLFWANTMNPDYDNYATMYHNIQYGGSILNASGVESGYILLMKLGTICGFSYEFFLAIVTFFSYLLIHNTVKKFCGNYNYVYLLYFVFPFCLDVVQLRNFIAMSIFIYSVKYLYDDSIKAKVKYIILILIASTIHYIAILYLPMILIRVREKNKLVRAIAIVSVLLSIIVVLNNKQIPFITQFMSMMANSDRVNAYFDHRTNWGFLLYWFIQIASFLMMFYSKVIVKKAIHNDKYLKSEIVTNIKDVHITNSKNAIMFVELVYFINLIAFIYLPLYIIDSTFIRIMRNIILLNYISFAIVNSKIKTRDLKIMYNFLVVIYVVILFLSELYLPYTENIMNTILQNNSIIG